MFSWIFRFLLGTSLICIFYCEETTQDEPNFLSLKGNIFILEINRISELPNVQFPSDQLEENEYVEISDGSEYEISFSDNLQIISIMPASISGTILEDTKDHKKYDLNIGLIAGGRFIVWITEEKFEAEYTVYGSGVPIIRSERGYLSSLE